MKFSKISWWLTAFLLFFPNPKSDAAARKAPLTVNFINEAADVPGIWDDAIRSDFVEAMNMAANDVSSYWRSGRPIIVGSDLRSATRLIVVDHPIYFDRTAVGGYHWVDRTGAYAIIDLTIAAQEEGAAGPFLFASHELDEMLADPGANRFKHRHFLEVVDPAVCCHYDLTLSDANIVPVNDFVLPAWFTPGATGPFDFINSPLIQAPLQYGPDGY
jgi:hypothetical protein